MFPARIYMFKVDNRNPVTRCEICSKLTIKTPERRSNISYPVIRNPVLEPPTIFSKGGGLTGPQLLEGGCWESGG